MSDKSFSLIKKKIIKNTAIVGIVGLGYVGLPLANLIKKKNFNVIGFDTNKIKINSLKKKKNYIPYLKLKFSKNISFTDNINDLENVDIIIVALPTPLKNKEPNLKSLKNFIKKFGSKFKNKLVIFESTSYPGTMREHFIKYLKNKSLVSGNNIFYSFSPERINPGENENNLYQIPKIISGETQKCEILIKKFYSKIFNKLYLSKNIETAEFTKILENVFRSINIAFINEIKYLAKPLNVNLIDAIEGAKTKPFGYMPFYPGPGIGGHCIPVDPLYLTWKAKKIGLKTRFINLSEKINQENVNKIADYVFLNKKVRKTSKILIMGASYKKNIDDARESSSLKLMNKLYSKKINFDYFDPFIKNLNKNDHEVNFNLDSLKEKNINFKQYEITILMTDHDRFDYKKIVKNSKLIIDTRYRFMKMNIDTKNIVNL